MPNKAAPLRVIARLDTKNGRLIKPVRFEGVRQIDNLMERVESYVLGGIDELAIFDVVSSLYNTPTELEVVGEISKAFSICIAAGGGVSSINDAEKLLRFGADKILINTSAVKNKDLIRSISREIGTQSTAVSIQAKKSELLGFEVMVEAGRQQTGMAVCDWMSEIQDLGAGEIIMTSVDSDGVNAGLDSQLISYLSHCQVDRPLILGGGFSPLSHVGLPRVIDGLLVGSFFHLKGGLSEDVRASVSYV